eukprot:scaffold14.g1323.t1
MRTAARRGSGLLRGVLQSRGKATPALAEEARLVSLTVNGKPVSVPEGSNILDATRALGIHVPTLCQHPRLPTTPGTCRLCQVETDKGVQIACGTPVWEGMHVDTSSQRVTETVKGVLAMFKANHPKDCMNCDAAGRCEFQDLIARYDVKDPLPRLRDFSVDWAEKMDEQGAEYHDSTRRGRGTALTIDLEKCVKCGRCVTMCQDVQHMNILGWVHRGREVHPGVLVQDSLSHSKCIECGQCSTVCPVGAIVEHTEWRKVLDELETRKKVLVVQTAPSVRVSIGEEMVTAQRMLGFDYVFDSNFSADLTIMEEGAPGGVRQFPGRGKAWCPLGCTELLQRLAAAWGGGGGEAADAAAGGAGAHAHHGPGPLPMFTSCCPAWINFVEKSYPELLPHISSCKSPQMMMGAVVKHYWANKMGLKPEDVCLKIPLASLPEGQFDNPLGEGTGAAALFGATGGVMEAALRTAYELATGESLPKLEVDAVRGLQGVKAATIALPANPTTEARGEGACAAGIAGKEVRVAVCSGIGNAVTLLKQMKAGEAQYDFVEVMACPGGCIGGGGQPKTHDPTAVLQRMQAIYDIDGRETVRKSHENASIKKIYADFFGEPGGERSHKLLHTHYTDLSRDTLPSVREMTKDDEAAAREEPPPTELHTLASSRLKKIGLVGNPTRRR